MVVYTFQNPKILELQAKELSCSPEYWEEDMATHYEWMYEQYQKRVGSQIKSLIWVWENIPNFYFEYDEEDDKYWQTGQLQQDRVRVLLTLDVPEERVLWSDYQSWHCPLNNFGILSNEEFEEEEKGKVFDMMYGWERVFDFEWLNKNGWDDVLKQGVVDKFDISDIKDVQYYDVKYKKIIDEEELIKFGR